MITNKSIQETVSSGKAQRCRRADKWSGTLRRAMSAFNSVSEISVSGVTVRALLVVGCSLLALAWISRSKPATSDTQIKVQIDDHPTPLYIKPLPRRRFRAIAALGGGSLVAGAVLACGISLILAVLFGVITSLLN